MTKLSFGTGGPRWRICSSGLNVEGICPTASCEAYEEMIIDQKVSRAAPGHLQKQRHFSGRPACRRPPASFTLLLLREAGHLLRPSSIEFRMPQQQLCV